MTNLHWLDGMIILVFLGGILTVAFRYTRQAGKDTQQFFLSGRNLPWYLAGTAMVATTFAADTPLAVTELVAQNGIAGNWLWWNMALGAVLTVFFFSRLWRRSGIITDVAFLEFRYSGKPAAFLRGFKAIYLGLLMNVIVLAWVHKAMEKIFRVVLPETDPFLLVIFIAGLITLYTAASGLLGTARTDSLQFVFAMAGCIILAVIVIRSPEIGGLIHLKKQLAPHITSFLPKITNTTVPRITGGAMAFTTGALVAHVGLQWWSSWYPGADPGGGGYIAQRMLSAKDERHSFLATLWFTIAHYTVRPWPWILVALSALVILPRSVSPENLRNRDPEKYALVAQAYPRRHEIESAGDPDLIQFYENYENTIDPGVMYPKLMVRCLPKGMLGLLIAVFLAAYMSTIAAQLNWGASYLINDLYKRFLYPGASEGQLIFMSRICIVCLTLVSLVIAGTLLTTISGAWKFIINASAGLGGVLILRWYWWRINAWSELAAMIAPFIFYPLAVFVLDLEFPMTLYPVVIGSTAIWLLVTYLTRPVETHVLYEFYQKVKPGGPGWRMFPPEFHQSNQPVIRMTFQWICGIIMVYGALFGMGSLLFGEYRHSLICLAAILLTGGWIFWSLKEGR
ncbi:Na+:solute symporter [bacterium]|nr:Na+:solute symporter [bacterium]